MASTFSGINTALTSLYAQRRGLDITGQNIANANTEGYTRQRVSLQSQTGSLNPGIYSTTTQVGNGVTVASVDRGRNVYLEERGRNEHAGSAYLARQTAAYSQIESVLAEPSDTALQARLHDMWDGWNDVANNWQDASTRSSLLEKSRTVAITLNDAHASLNSQFTAASTQMSGFVDQVNTLAESIADMNNQVVVAQSSGLEANELQDRRDVAIMKLAELAGVTTQAKANGSINVYLGSSPLVSDFSTRTLEASGPETLDSWAAGTNTAQLTWKGTTTPAAVGGTMGAMLDTMNSIIPGIKKQLDDVAETLATRVNTLHAGAYDKNGGTGADFFEGWSATDGWTARDIKVAITDPDEVAFSQGDPNGTPPALDNDVADMLAALGTDPNGPDQTYQKMIGQLGVSAQSAARRSEIQDAVRDQIDTSRQAESGVNLDEEMTNLLTFQRGYEAASRVLTTIDSMLDQLINRTGLVGR
ncbi:flagellar hook-associated protein FlgK [Paractinoplanes brasiliensis]|uniref:Flagellar hook-associated protein 1 n=1 Tax=Paractinoplanes brasiliensis TaxID=52695 RepID=A0A4R6JV07_9ACTN|nr:flagellar hook-associated protein FlgK [Actinoplanes brasiliensis]TDO40037.1 flagellar hook-associated protein 1 FlgK [Actinoplanes brasiliensis]GID25102.1 flagellar hook-associated protein FlgK [Actinoplanes brasiliensis]